MFVTKGYTTKNNKFEVLYDKELALHNLELELNINRGECDFDTSKGTLIKQSMFSKNTPFIKSELEDSIRDVINNQSYFELIDIETVDEKKGYTFNISLKCLIDDSTVNLNYSI